MKDWFSFWWHRGVMAGLLISLLSGFTLFAVNGTFYRWNISNGETVPLILNPAGCDCGLTDEEVLTVFRNAILSWNEVNGSFFQFTELIDESPELFEETPALAELAPTLEDGYNVMGFSSEVGGAFAGFSASSYEGHHIIETDIFLGIAVTETADQLESLVLHELGHSLGLGHDHTDTNSIMSYGRSSDATSLGSDDIIGITTLYPKSGRSPKPDIGCGAFLGPGGSDSFFDGALWNFLLLMLWSFLGLSIIRWSHRNPTSEALQIVRTPQFYQGFSLGIVLVLFAVACADVDDAPQASLDWNQIHASGLDHGIEMLSGDEQSSSGTGPVIDHNQMTFFCPKP